MRFSVLRRVLVLTAVVCASTQSLVYAEQPLRWKFKVGEKLDYDVQQDMVMDMGGGQLKTQMRQSIDMTWDVKSVNEEGQAIIEHSVDRMQMKMSMPGGQGFEYDSDAEAPAEGMAAMIAPMFEAMTSGKVEVTMSARGEILDVKVPEDMAKALAAGQGAGAGDEKAAVEHVKQMISQSSFVLPENSPSVGEQWNSKVTVNNPGAGEQTMETTYKYEGTRDIDGTTFAVFKPTLKMSLAGNPMMQMNVKDQKTDGEVLFDPEAGRLHSTSIDQDIALDIAVAGQTMPGTIDQKIEVRVTPATETNGSVEKNTATAN